MIFSHIVAFSKNRVIGKNNQLPWHLPADAKFFKDTTKGHVVIMGRKNYEAEGKPLKDRTNIIITRQKNYKAPDCVVVPSIDIALKKALLFEKEEVFVIGGGEIYKQSMHLMDKLYITEIDINVEGDVYYPEVNYNDWELISKRNQSKDTNNTYDHVYYEYERKRK